MNRPKPWCVHRTRHAALAIAALAPCVAIAADEPTFTVRLMTPETALATARVALEHCRNHGCQVAVAVVDRAGTLQRRKHRPASP